MCLHKCQGCTRHKTCRTIRPSWNRPLKPLYSFVVGQPLYYSRHRISHPACIDGRCNLKDSRQVDHFFFQSIVFRYDTPVMVITVRATSGNSIYSPSCSNCRGAQGYTSHKKTTAYSPQTMGLTEHMNKTISNMPYIHVCRCRR